MKLWPGQPPGSKADPSYVETLVHPDWDPDIELTSNVSEPKLEVFLPEPGKGTGAAVVICPGGGYQFLAKDHEGVDVAQWLAGRGIAGLVLRYRLPADAIMQDRTVGPLQDAQEAIRTARRNAAAWGLDPAKIGIMGFSAGGHVAATASTLYDERVYEPSDATSARPDFTILVYAVVSMREGITHEGSRDALLGRDPAPELVARFSADEHAGPQTPPAFLVHSADDAAVPLENSLRYCRALWRHGVAAELHVYPRGNHGYGLGIYAESPSWWPEALAQWLRASGWWRAPRRRRPVENLGRCLHPQPFG